MYNALAGCHQNIHPPPQLQWLGSVFRRPLTLAASRIALPSSSPTFYLFIPSSHAFRSVSSLLPHLLSPLILPHFFPQPPSRRGICFCQTYFRLGLFDRTRNQRVKEGRGDGRPKTVSQHMLYVIANSPLRSWWRRVDWKEKKTTIYMCMLEPTQVHFLGLVTEICCNAK